MSKISKILGVLVMVTMILAACAPATTPPPAATQPPAATEAPTEVMTEAPTEAPTEAAVAECPEGYDFGEIVGPPGGFLEQALAGDFTGTTVTVDGTQTDPDDRKMKCGWAAFEEATGITVNYVGNKEFEARISIAVDAGEAPDIADFPQPSLVRRFAEQGKLVDVGEFHRSSGR